MTGAQTIEMLMKRVATLGGVQTGQFLVDCDTCASTPNLGKFLFYNSFSFYAKFCSIHSAVYRVISEPDELRINFWLGGHGQPDAH